MTPRCVSGILIIALMVSLATPARADTLKTDEHEIVAGIVGAVAAVVVVVVLVIHYSTKKRTITGCVVSGANGMSVTDEKDGQVYALSGNTMGIKAGDRMKLHGRRLKSKGPDKTPIWDATEVTKDFGVCHP